MKTEKTGIELLKAHLERGYDIVEINPERDVWIEERYNGTSLKTVKTYRIFWNDLTAEQKANLLTYC